MEAEKKQRDEQLLQDSVKRYLTLTQKNGYPEKMKWMGVPIMQYPEDMFALQDVLWDTKPTCVIMTGMANSGVPRFVSSIMNAYMENPLVIIIDSAVVDFNSAAKFNENILPLCESSVDEETTTEVSKLLTQYNVDERVMVILNSRHETEHVLSELQLWSKFVSLNCYLIVCWTVIGESSDSIYRGKAWHSKSNPLIAVNKFLNCSLEFALDGKIRNKYLMLTAGQGYLKRVRIIEQTNGNFIVLCYEANAGVLHYKRCFSTMQEAKTHIDESVEAFLNRKREMDSNIQAWSGGRSSSDFSGVLYHREVHATLQDGYQEWITWHLIEL